jgi:hypothetical protein
VYGARPSKEEVNKFAQDHRDNREPIIKAKMWVALAINGVALIIGGVIGYGNGMDERERNRRYAAQQQQEQAAASRTLDFTPDELRRPMAIGEERVSPTGWKIKRID